MVPTEAGGGGVDFDTGYNSTEGTIKFIILYIILIYGSVTTYNVTAVT